RHIVLIYIHPFDVRDQYRIEDLAQLDVVVLAARAVTELAEVEPGDAAGGLACNDLPVLNHQHIVFGDPTLLWQQAAKTLLQALLRFGAQRKVIKLSLLQGAQAIVDTAVDVDDLGMLLQQFNGWQEAGSLQAVLVEAIGNDVGGRHQAHAILEQLFEQSRQNHRVGDVGNEEFVEADHPGLSGKALADDGQRVFLALEGAHFFVHTLHEAVEVGTGLLLKRQSVEERVYQIGLATANPSPEVQPLDRPLLLFAEELAQQAGGRTLSRNQVIVQTLQVTNGCFLGCIAQEICTLQVCLIALERCHGRVWVVKRGRYFSRGLGGWQFAQIVQNS